MFPLLLITVSERKSYANVRVNYTSTYRIQTNSNLSKRYLLQSQVTLDVSNDVFLQLQDEAGLSPQLISTEIHREYKLEC